MLYSGWTDVNSGGTRWLRCSSELDHAPTMQQTACSRFLNRASWGDMKQAMQCQRTWSDYSSICLCCWVICFNSLCCVPFKKQTFNVFWASCCWCYWSQRLLKHEGLPMAFALLCVCVCVCVCMCMCLCVCVCMCVYMCDMWKMKLQTNQLLKLNLIRWKCYNVAHHSYFMTVYYSFGCCHGVCNWPDCVCSFWMPFPFLQVFSVLWFLLCTAQ